MSKLRDDVTLTEGDLTTPPEGDLGAYVIFTQLRIGGPFVYAGWLDAADDAMALQFAREHYGQDQKCLSIWAVARPHLGGTDEQYPPSSEPGPPRPFVVFVQSESGSAWESSAPVEAEHAVQAIERARRDAPDARSIWVVEAAHVLKTDEGDLIWRFTDQTYRLARGYSKDVRDKWEKIRAERDIEEYEKEDLKESF